MSATPFDTRSRITRLFGIEPVAEDAAAGTITLAYHPDTRMTNPRGEVQGGIVAALLTVIGYSLNDTIVILDRIRENRGRRPVPSKSIVNTSINQTVSRTL